MTGRDDARNAPTDPRVQPARFEPPDQRAPARRPSRSFLPALLVLAGLLLFALAGGYLFTAESVGIRFDPDAESIAIDGGLTLPFGERHLMRPGDYVIRASRAGYEPFEQGVRIESGEDRNFSFKLSKLPGRLQLVSKPSGAQVEIDGEPVGETPLKDHRLAAGPHELTVRAPRHEVWTQAIDIEGLDRAQSVEAELVPAWAAISFSSAPAGATLLIDGEPAGETPLKVDVGAGDHRLEYRLTGYQTAERPLSVTANKPQTLDTVQLEKALGRLQISSEPAGASITIDGQFKGRTPLTVGIEPGRSVALRATRAGYEAASRQLSLAAGEQQSLRLELAAILGAVRVSATPADARLFVDGEDRGPARQTLELTAVAHKLSIRKPGYVSHEVTITPRPDKAQQVEVQLRSEAQVKAEATPQRITTATGQTLQLIQPGRFVMGSARREQGRQNNEVAQPVKLTRAFYLARHEVSNADYRKFSKRHSSGIIQRTTLDNDNYPVVRVSWDDAVAFCNWLSERDGLPKAYAGGKLVTPVNTGYRLPTEAEWAYAARFAGGRDLKYPWGASMPPTGRAGNYADTSAAELLTEHLDSYSDGHRAAAPVGRFDANALGIHDLGGNVSEWVNDRAGGLSLIPGPELSDPLGQEGSGSSHRVRGSSWRHGRITELRLAWRDAATGSRDDLGFRIARYAE